MASIRCCCWRPVQRTPISGSTCRSAMASCSRTRPSTGCTRPSRSRDWTAAAYFSRAARCWADRARSTACCMCAASTRITIAGGSAAMPDGAMTTCCPISRRPKTSNAAPDEYHGAGGPLPVSDSRHADPLSDAFIVAAAETGIPDQSRFQRRDPGRRRLVSDHDADAAGAPARHFPIFARRKAEATCISRPRRWRSAFCSRGAAPAAVEYRQGGAVRTARARKEILVSSGAYNSPQLLQLSGVGPAELLNSTASASCSMRPASATICRITCRSGS